MDSASESDRFYVGTLPFNPFKGLSFLVLLRKLAEWRFSLDMFIMFPHSKFIDL